MTTADQNKEKILKALEGIELDEGNHKVVSFVAGSDTNTVDEFIDLVKRIRELPRSKG